MLSPLRTNKAFPAQRVVRPVVKEARLFVHRESRARPPERCVRLGSAPGDAALGRRLFRGDLVADLLERAPDQARDVHLRDPDLLRDLRLREPLEEAQVQDRPLAVVEHSEPGREHRTVLGDLVLMFFGPERLERVEIVVVVPAAAPLRERQRRVRAPRLERLEHFLLLASRRLRELRDRRRPRELNGELLDQLGELDVELLQPARDAHGPPAVAEVALDLADDVRRRVRRQLDAAVEVEAVDCLDQPDRADLDEILELLAAVRVAARERAHERHVLLDELLARGEVAVLVVAAQQLTVVLTHYALSIDASDFSIRTQYAWSRSSSSTASASVSSTRRRPSSSSSPCSSSERIDALRNGPIETSMRSSVSRTSSVTGSLPSRRSSSGSSASSRSSNVSIVRLSRAARPPSTRCATGWNGRSRGIVSVIATFIQRAPAAAPPPDRPRGAPRRPWPHAPPRSSRASRGGSPPRGRRLR